MAVPPTAERSRGQSAVIGFVLMFGLIILLMTVLQVSAVPAWNQGEEFAHSQQVRGELELLRDDVTTAAATGRVTSESVSLGLRYPRRPFLLNPADPTGRLRTTAVGTVELTNLAASGETGDYWDGSVRRFDTRHVVYRPGYNEYDNPPTTVLENSVLYDRYGDRTRPLTAERVVSGRRITLVTLDGSISRSSSRTADIEVTPVSAPEQVTSVEGTGPVRLRLPTRLDEAAWNDLLRDEFVRNGGHVYDNVSVSPGSPYDTVTITLQENQTYDLRMAKVRLGQQSAQAPAHYITTDAGQGGALTTDGSRRLVFEVRDRYNNPVSGVRVDTTLVAAEGTVSAVDPVTDEQGHATFRYTASTPGTAIINATFGTAPAALETATIRLDVTGGTGTGGADDEGPTVSEIGTSETTASGQSVPQGTAFAIRATATDFQRGGTDIYAVEWWSNRSGPGGGPGSGFALDPVDDGFDSVREPVSAPVDTADWRTGRHDLSVRARDANGNWGPVATYEVVVTEADGDQPGDGGPSDGGDPGDGGSPGNADPPGERAFDDANGNGRYDDGEATYSKAALERGFDDTSVNLVVPGDVGPLNLRNRELKARNIVIRTDIDTRGGDVTLTAENDVDIAGRTLRTRGGDIEIQAGEDGSGRLLASGATIDTNRDIQITAAGDVRLDGATVSAGNEADIEVDLGRESATLFVDGARIDDDDDTIEYSPEEVTRNGTPAQGRVDAE
jgi:hypothetical protein